MTTKRERLALRARAVSDPSDRLVLSSLAAHRVLTTHQLARVLARAQGTVEWRMRRLRAAGLVASTRPARLVGTAPLHFWLTAAGHRMIGSDGPARDPETPNVLFLAHTTAVAGLALALAEAPGLRLVGWRREEEAWEWWRITSGGFWSGPREGDEWKLRPDALAVLELETVGIEAHVFVEVDRGTMTHKRLRTKLTGYLRYAADRGWHDRHPFCPPLLFLTASDERAATFLAGSADLRAGRDLGWAAGTRVRELVVAACALVDDPDTAAGAPVWRTDDGRGPAALAELLATVAGGRLAALAAERAENEARDADTITARRAEAWADIVHAAALGNLPLRSRLVADALAFLAVDAAGWRTTEPAMCAELADWWWQRRFSGDPMPSALAETLAGFARQRWHEQAGALLAGRPLPLPADVAALRLADDRLALPDPDLDRRDASRVEAMARHADLRARSVAAELRDLGPLRRLRADADQLAADFDAAHLVVCADCGAERPKDHQRPACPRCGCRHVRPWHERARVPTTQDRLAAIRAHTRRPSR